MQTDRDHWEAVTFGDVVREVTDHERDPEERGLDRYVGLDHLDPGDLRIRRWGQISEGVTFTKTFQAGQVLFGKRRVYQKKAGVPDFDGLCSGDIIVLEVKDQRMLPEFLPYLVQSDAFFTHAEKTSSGSLSPRTKFRELARFEFLLPSLEQQHELVELMQGFEAAIEAGIETLDAAFLVQDVFLTSVIGISNNSSKRTNHKHGKLGDFITLQRGFDITNKEVREGNIPVISSSGITAYHDTPMVKGPGVVLGRKGTLGNVFYTKEDYWPHDTSLWVKEFGDNLPDFIEILLKYLKLERFDAATACPTLNRNTVHMIPVNMPPVQEQRIIVNKHKLIKAHLLAIQNSLTSSKALKLSILNSILTPITFTPALGTA